ncbi:MAG: HyaD/HybD family hydrogenase maturation endopeptidase [Vulcanibacillus sp.]
MFNTPQEEIAKNIKIIGIGNTLFSDEGVGVHLLSYIRDLIPETEHLEIIEGATDGIKLLQPVEESDYLIILDAINSGKEPGTVITLQAEEIPKYFGLKVSVHQLGFHDVLNAALIRDSLPEKIIMFGVQPESLELGLEVTDSVKKSMPTIVDLVVNQVKLWTENQ